MLAHPIQTATAIGHGVYTAGKDIACGDLETIGRAAGTITTALASGGLGGEAAAVEEPIAYLGSANRQTGRVADEVWGPCPVHGDRRASRDPNQGNFGAWGRALSPDSRHDESRNECHKY
jgi:hypothetical protein